MKVEKVRFMALNMAISGRVIARSHALHCCVPGTAHILKDELNIPTRVVLGKSPAQPGGGEPERSGDHDPQGRVTAGNGNGVALLQGVTGDGDSEGGSSATAE